MEKLKIKEAADGRPTSKSTAQASCLRKIYKSLEEDATYYGSLPENGPQGKGDSPYLAEASKTI